MRRGDRNPGALLTQVQVAAFDDLGYCQEGAGTLAARTYNLRLREYHVRFGTGGPVDRGWETVRPDSVSDFTNPAPAMRSNYADSANGRFHSASRMRNARNLPGQTGFPPAGTG